MINNRELILYRYSQYSVDRNIDRLKVLNLLYEELNFYEKYIYQNNDAEITFYYKKDDWESHFFSLISIKIFYIDFLSFNKEEFRKAINQFSIYIKKIYGEKTILTTEVPSEDTYLIQALNDSRFRTIETRLHFVNNNLDVFNNERYLVRKADISDIPNLRRIASYMRNDFDRFHADWSFNIEKADEYLSTYIENSILGFTDLVIVPNQPELPPDSFLTANYLEKDWTKLDYEISKMVLSAVSSETNKGWYIKLISEMTFLLKENGAKSIFMNTQATNIAVLVTWEKLGYRIGRTTHILTLNLND